MTWRDNLVPASFRGAAFYVESREYQGGRRKVVQEFPGRDAPNNQDQGRKARRHRVEAYCVGDDYQDMRDALQDACEGHDGPGTLVLPWKFAAQVSCEDVSYVEKRTEGSFVVFSLTFIEEAGAPPAPVAAADTSQTALGAIQAAFAAVRSAFGVAFSVAHEGFYVVAAASAMATDLTARVVDLAGIPIAYLGGVASSVAPLAGGISGALAAPETFAGAISGAFQAYGDGVVAYGTDLSTGAAPSYSSSGVNLARDPTAGLGRLAADFAADYAVLPPPVTPDRVAQGVNQQAIADLVNAAVALAVAQIFARGDFDSANAAASARDQMLSLFAGPIERAADSGADDLYIALRDARAAALTDIAARGASLPSLVRYATPNLLNALALAHLLYPDWPKLSKTAPDTAKAWPDFDSIVQDLVARNQAVHPCFMPASGQALSG